MKTGAGPSPFCLAAGCLAFNAIANGMAVRTTAANKKAVFCQPMPWIIPPASGENKNWPKDPAAVPMPNAKGRFSGGNNFWNAPMIMLKEAQDKANPNKTP